MDHNFKFGNLTDVGLVREANEDYYGCFDTPNGFVFVVCDGMGGHVGGAIASQTAVEAIKVFYESTVYENIIVSMQNALSYANNAILNKITELPDLKGMGTTAVLLIVKDDKVYYAHVGDSRIYYVHKKNLYRITRDHSIVQALVDGGHITEEEAETHPKKNQIIKALGIQPGIEATICNEPILPVAGDCFLLCSDGLTGMVNDNLITKVIKNEKNNLQEKVAELVQLAKQNGGVDNITAQMILFDKTTNSQSNFKAPPEHLIKNQNRSKVTGRQKTWLWVLGSVLILSLLYWGYSYYYLPQSKPSTPESKNKKDSVPGSSVSTKTDVNTVSETLSYSDVDSVSKKYDTETKSPGSGNSLPNPKPGADKKESKSIEPYLYTIKDGDNVSVIGRKFKTTWEQLNKEDKAYPDSLSPREGKIIKIRVRDALTFTSLKEMEEVIKSLMSINNLKDSSKLIILKEEKMVLVRF